MDKAKPQYLRGYRFGESALVFVAYPCFRPNYASLLRPSIVSAHASASLSGTVADPSFAAVAAANVTVRNVNTGVIRNAATDDAGRFQFFVLRARFKATRPGTAKKIVVVIKLYGIGKRIAFVKLVCKFDSISLHRAACETSRGDDLPRKRGARVDGFNIGVADKVLVIERQNALDAMHSHRRHQARVMDLHARNAM